MWTQAPERVNNVIEISSMDEEFKDISYIKVIKQLAESPSTITL